MGTTNIDRPIFVIGCGRSGTTLLFRLLTRHPDLAWFSNYQDRYPGRGWSASLSRIWEVPYFGPKIAGRLPGLLFSHESIGIYQACGIHELIWKKQASLDESDLTPESAQCFQQAVITTLAARGKTRFVNKDTNNCMRIRYLKAIFPDARFIHILRDGRAVANSLYRVDWWPELRLWWAGFTPRDWQSSGREPIELCGLHWQREVSEIRTALASLEPDSSIELRYEDLTNDPLRQMRRLMEFCDLTWTPQYERQLRKIKVDDKNFKWAEQLSLADLNVLTKTIGNTLSKLGYAPHQAFHSRPSTADPKGLHRPLGS